MFVQVSVQVLILLLSKKYTETPTTGGFETIFESSGAFGIILYLSIIIRVQNTKKLGIRQVKN